MQTANSLAAKLALAYPGRAIDEGHLASWAGELARLEPWVAEGVVERLRHRAVEPPSLAQVRQCANEVMGTTASPRSLLSEASDMPENFAEKVARIGSSPPLETEAEWRKRLGWKPRT